jgi:hypothetical protein
MLPARGSALAAYILVRLTSLPVGGLNPSIPVFRIKETLLSLCIILVSDEYLGNR